MRVVTEALQGNFDSSTQMLENLITLCPDDVWLDTEGGAPFWHQVYHVVFFIDFWLREQHDDGSYRDLMAEKGLSPHLQDAPQEGQFLSRCAMSEYLSAILTEVAAFFDSLDDEKLAEKVAPEMCPHTFADAIAGQLRHIMYNLGLLNGILRRHGLPEADWYAYNEVEGS